MNGIFVRITQSFSDSIHIKGSMVTGFFPNAVLFLAIAAILYSLAMRVRGPSILLLWTAVFAAMLIAGMLPPMNVSDWPQGVSVVFIAVCIFLTGCFPIWLARMSSCSRLGRFFVALTLYFLLLCRFIANCCKGGGRTAPQGVVFPLK